MEPLTAPGQDLHIKQSESANNNRVEEEFKQAMNLQEQDFDLQAAKKIEPHVLQMTQENVDKSIQDDDENNDITPVKTQEYIREDLEHQNTDNIRNNGRQSDI